MAVIQSFGSGSSGNLYLIESNGHKLMLEAGLKMQDIKKALGFQVSSLDAVLISHSHMDHAKSVKDLVKMGKTCYMSPGCAKELCIDHHRIKTVPPRVPFKAGAFTVLPFEVEHDTDAPYGYLIGAPCGEKILFATDTYFIRHRFKGLNKILIECNFAEDILDANISAGSVHKDQRKRLLKSHFSLENVKDFLKANDLSQVEEIWLLHLSDRNSDEERFKREIAELTGVPVYIAQ